ncbi:MAG: DNA-3-methyladenine glycosylase [Planctomycetota bacterium]
MSLPIPRSKQQLSPDFFARETALVARELIGQAFLHRTVAADGKHRWVGGWIVETEAYLPRRDLASHSARGKTPSNQSMFREPGVLYVYPIHAKYCVNISTESLGCGAAVLIRALEPAWGISTMQQHRSQTDDRRLTSGPGMICQALNIDRQSDGNSPHRDPTWRLTSTTWASSPSLRRRIRATPRIGIRQSMARRLRFILSGNRYVSGPAADHDRPRQDSIIHEWAIHERTDPNQ